VWLGPRCGLCWPLLAQVGERGMMSPLFFVLTGQPNSWIWTVLLGA
jgi:hypothetical protein